jgi:hypothetical protein
LAIQFNGDGLDGAMLGGLCLLLRSHSGFGLIWILLEEGKVELVAESSSHEAVKRGLLHLGKLVNADTLKVSFVEAVELFHHFQKVLVGRVLCDGQVVPETLAADFGIDLVLVLLDKATQQLLILLGHQLIQIDLQSLERIVEPNVKPDRVDAPANELAAKHHFQKRQQLKQRNLAEVPCRISDLHHHVVQGEVALWVPSYHGADAGVAVLACNVDHDDHSAQADANLVQILGGQVPVSRHDFAPAVNETGVQGPHEKSPVLSTQVLRKLLVDSAQQSADSVVHNFDARVRWEDLGEGGIQGPLLLLVPEIQIEGEEVGSILVVGHLKEDFKN